MRAPLLLGLGALIGGASGALATVWLAPRPAPVAAAAPSSDEDEDGPEEERPQRTSEALDDEAASRIAALERRLSLLTAAYTQLSGERAGAGEGEGQLPSQADVADPVFEAAVLDILDREKERQEKERIERRNEVQTQRNQRRASELTTRLGLNERQSQELTALIGAHYEALARLREGENPPQTRDEWRARVGELTQQNEEKLRGVLSPGQFAEYEKLEPEEKLGGGRGRGGREGPPR